MADNGEVRDDDTQTCTFYNLMSSPIRFYNDEDELVTIYQPYGHELRAKEHAMNSNKLDITVNRVPRPCRWAPIMYLDSIPCELRGILGENHATILVYPDVGQVLHDKAITFNCRARVLGVDRVSRCEVTGHVYGFVMYKDFTVSGFT